MALSAGARLGPYEILTPLGAGGMGEVYRARDTRLDRIVAIKVLPPALAADPQFRERFAREAKSSPDGKWFIYHTASTRPVAMLRPFGAGASSKPLVDTKATIWSYNAEISPDGRWVAYQSDESGRFVM